MARGSTEGSHEDHRQGDSVKQHSWLVTGGISTGGAPAICCWPSKNTAGGNEMYGMSGPELLAQLKMRDTLRDAERIHQVSTVLKERKAARQALLALKRARFWRGSDTSRPALPSPTS